MGRSSLQGHFFAKRQEFQNMKIVLICCMYSIQAGRREVFFEICGFPV